MLNREKLLKQLRDKLKRRETSIGTWLQSGSAEVAEILADAGYDWVMFDMEHGSISTADFPNLIRATLDYDCLPLVRVLKGNASSIKKALDAGAAGIMVPDVKELGSTAKNCL